MFQYAFGRGVSAALGRRLVLDASGLPSGAPPHQRHFELEGLPLNPAVRTIGRCRAESAATRRGRLGCSLRRSALRAVKARIVREEGLDRLLPVEGIPRGLTLLQGYWQSPLYFRDLAHEIRAELTPKLEPGGAAERLLMSLAGYQTILVHIRRGDYVSVAEAHDFHGVQAPSYYQKAVEMIAELSQHRVAAVVVSDDPVWASQNIYFSIPTRHAELTSSLSHFEALALMARCNHHVISNSSFSWWGAWLADRPEQHVVYPERWFLKHEVNPAFRFPNDWQPFSGDGKTTYR